MLLDAHELLEDLKKLSSANGLLVHTGLKIRYNFITEEIFNHNHPV